MKKYVSWIISGVLLIAAGIFMLVKPESVVKIAVIAFGVYTVLEGLSALLVSSRIKEVRGIFRANLIKALINLFVGILVVYFAAVSTGAQVASWVVYLIAINLLLSSLTEFLELAYVRKNGFETYGLSTGALLSIIFAIIMFLFPTFINNTFFMIVAICLIFAGFTSILWGWRLIRIVRGYERQMAGTDKVAEAEWTEKKD